MRAALVTSLVTALLALPLSFAQAAPTHLVGPDVSSYQHPNGQAINWDTVFGSGGQSFAIVKATEDADFTSPTFAGDWQKLEAKGAIRGTYHYAQPSTAAGDAVAEARWYVSKAGPMNKPGHLPPVLDLEEHNGMSTAQMQAWTRAWLDEVQKLTGRKPMIYTSAGFWNARVNSSAFGSYPLQVAHFTSDATPNLPVGWSNWTLWQYTESGTVAGIPAKTDHNRFRGTAAQLRALAGYGGSSGMAGDVTGDGNGDLVMHSRAVNGAGDMWVWQGGNGDRFWATPKLPFSGSAYGAKAKMALSDINGDGTDDVVWARELDADSVELRVIPGGPGIAGFGELARVFHQPLDHIQLAGGDVTGDGKGDLAVYTKTANGAADLYVFLGGDGDGFWASAKVPFSNSAYAANAKITVSDVGGDGAADIVLARPKDADTTELRVIKGGANPAGFGEFQRDFGRPLDTITLP